MLTSLGITFSKKLLSIHLGSFWVASLVYIPDTFMTIAVGLQLQNNDYSHNSLAFTQTLLEIIAVTALGVALATMLTML